ncbi:LLM class flavin-dependent oxidoreductase [Kibdelosporangium philippinense]|uniref:LLM class flavin-dependent oxidoreductase n=1 Tax=Kibdelosporangium philippinense TaxID=211113 RepID=A0ABS8ZGF0_9PSEU|nr:LLM class flavin-dependent oxidoreductase [Kibdelosporangium philippinense]MCE7006899.1 LLM class flavin-dependent oxidoreductase [Kibdelosporangium philippinense]
MNVDAFSFGVAISAPANDIQVLAARTADLQAADFLILTGGAGERAGLAPIPALGFLAPHTTIGLVAEVDVSYVEPFFASRELATLDHATVGRAGWQLKVDTSGEAARKRGLSAPLPPDELAERVVEYTTVVCDLWDSWDDDAVVRDRARGIFIRADRVHRLDHVGKYFRMRGPANLPRPFQGHLPTFVSLTGDAHSSRLASEVGEVIRIRATSADEVGAVRARFPQARVLVDVPFTGMSATLAAIDGVSEVAQGIVVELDALDLGGTPLTVLAAELTKRGLRGDAPRTGTFRERLGLPAAISRFASKEIS